MAFERAVAAELARHGPVSGETFRWIRKAAALERMELARLLGVAPETIAGWEEERRPVDLATWTLVAAMVLDALEGPRPLRARLKARSGAAAREAMTEIKIERVSCGTVANVLYLLSGPIAFTDSDIADALDVDLRSLRGRLRDLALLGLVESAGTGDDGPQRWDPISRDRATLLRAAIDAGVDVDATIARAHAPEMKRPVAKRVSPVTWRGAS
jgi:DNA-binding XRE family transcriptional regulator